MQSRNDRSRFVGSPTRKDNILQLGLLGTSGANEKSIAVATLTRKLHGLDALLAWGRMDGSGISRHVSSTAKSDMVTDGVSLNTDNELHLGARSL